MTFDPEKVFSDEWRANTKFHCVCDSEYEFVEEYDAFMCRKCDDWLEPRCLWESECKYCKERPSKPSMIRKENEEAK